MKDYIRPADADIARLPLWAREHVKYLRHLNTEKDKQIAELTSDHPDSNVQLNGHLSYPNKTLPPDSEVIFYMGDSRDKYRETIEVRHLRDQPGTLTFTTSGAYITMRPWASNVMRVSITGY